MCKWLIEQEFDDNLICICAVCLQRCQYFSGIHTAAYGKRIEYLLLSCMQLTVFLVLLLCASMHQCDWILIGLAEHPRVSHNICMAVLAATVVTTV